MIRRHRPRHGDRGATLILAIIIVTVISVVIAAILTQADTNVRATVGLQEQAASNYGTDGATNAVLNALKTSSLNCTSLSTPATLTLGNTTGNPFYSPGQSPQGPINAFARCAVDSVKGVEYSTTTPPPTTTVNTVTPSPTTSTSYSLGHGDSSLPSYALLTTGTTSNDFGIDFSQSASNKDICVEDGSVASASNIDVSGGGSKTGITLSVKITGTGSSTDCTTGTGTAADGSQLSLTAAGQCLQGSGFFKPTPCTPSTPPAVQVPTAPALPSGSVDDNPAMICTTSGSTAYAALKPGRYTDVSKLNNPCPGTSLANTFMWLTSGVYYFDYGSTQWTWPNRLIAGNPIDKNTGQPISGLVLTTPSSLTKLSNAKAAPGGCDDPATNNSAQGAELVFGGASTVLANSGSTATAELCASGSSSSVPVSIYGLNSAATITLSGGGTATVPAETMCTGASGCGTSSLINTDVSGQAAIYVHGYVYAPNAQMILSLKNSLGQLFNWGIVIRNFRLSINGASPTQPFIQLPRANTGVGTVITTTTPPPYPSTSITSPPPSTSTSYTIRYVDVWTCTVQSLQASGATQCPSSGTPSVEIRVQLDASGNMTILSWNHIRG